MNNKKGLTLIELVIVLALIGILSSLLFFPILFSFDNFEKQSNTVNEITTARSTIEFLTKEIRKVDDFNQIDASGNSLKIGTVEYKLVDKTLTKDNQKLFVGIESLFFDKSSDNKSITITIQVTKKKGEAQKLSSTIYMRLKK